jgi:N-acetylmuramoyl-L-alanine amidase
VSVGLWLGSVVYPTVVAPSLALAQSSKSSENGKVTAVRFWSLGDVTRVAVEVSSDFTFKYNRLTDPERLFFDLSGTVPRLSERAMHTIPVNDSLLRQIRVAEKEPGVTRIVLDMAKAALVTPSQLSNPSRLVIELRPIGSQTGTDQTGTEKDKPASAPRITENRAVEAPQADSASKRKAEAAEPVQDLVAIEVRPKKKNSRKFVPPVMAHKLPKMEAIAPPSIKLPLLTLNVNITSASFAKNLPVLAPAPIAPSPAPTVAVKAGPPAVIREIPETAPVAAKEAPARESKLSVNRAADPVPAKHGTISGDRSLTRALGLKLGRVVLDPGHGGHDQGTHGPSGYTEKELTLDVALRLGALIEERLGSEVVFTRNDDTFIPLEERTHIANDHKADLFLSIHANSSTFRSAAGVETYVLNFTTSKTAMDLAARENASSQKSIYDLQELLQKIALRDKIGESLEFASRLQTSLSTLSARSNEAAKNRGIKRAPFVVLIGATMPSVLAEIGFLTNPSDENLLRTPEHRQKIAESLYKGIAAYADTLSRFQVASGASRTRRSIDSKP